MSALVTLDQAEADLRHAAKQTEILRRHIAVQRANEEFRLTRFEIAAGVLVVLATIVLSHVFPWGWAG